MGRKKLKDVNSFKNTSVVSTLLAVGCKSFAFHQARLGPEGGGLGTLHREQPVPPEAERTQGSVAPIPLGEPSLAAPEEVLHITLCIFL